MREMIVSIAKWGNSHAIRIPKEILEKAKLGTNDKIEIFFNGQEITIKKMDTSKSARLAQRFADYQGTYKCEELDSGFAVGKEVLE